MLGPLRSSKTTLLTALGGHLGRKLDGSITYSNKPFSNSMKRNTSFVTQDDFLYPHLTVTETLIFMGRAKKTIEAKAVICKLELTKCKNNIIRDEYIRGVSGRERRMVSI